MANFSRVFPFLPRLFPPQGPSLALPDEILGTVNFTNELYRADLKHQIRLRQFDQTLVSAGASVTHTFGEPSSDGRAVVWANVRFLHGDVAAAQVTLAIDDGALDSDPQLGRWTPGTLVSINAAQSKSSNFGVPVPIMPNNVITVTFSVSGAGISTSVTAFGVEVPLEVIDWVQAMRLMGQSTVNTT